MIFYYMLMLLPVYCGACSSVSSHLWKEYFTQGIQTYCEKMTGSPPKMKFEESLISSIQNFVYYGKRGNSSVVRIFKVANRYGCQYMRKLVNSMIENIVSNNDDSPQKTCQMFDERKNFFCTPHYEPYVAWGDYYIKPVVFCSFSVR
ncbi:unnamed protein product [Cylicocyclus nassatus]|uniref:SAND domain-containing protein n=1 Tax=Cylicocyclus nassatus TaxID=53992 RepID=A0AA36GIB1_CYLNA|nr:unnamed protein product [Cylicocyclus nassatus]